MTPRDARVHQVHIGSEAEAKPRLITSNTGVYRPGDRVLVEVSPSLWLRGHVDARDASGPGGVIMVTLLS